MTSKERIKATFAGEKADRIPIWLMFPFESEPIAADVYNRESYREIVKWVVGQTDFIERNTVNTDFLINTKGVINIDFLFNHPEVHKSREIKQKGRDRITIDRIEYKDFTLQKSVGEIDGQRQVEPYVRNIEDIGKITKMPYQIPEIDFDFFRKRAERLGDKGLHGILLIDPISIIHDICSETDFTIWPHASTNRF